MHRAKGNIGRGTGRTSQSPAAHGVHGATRTQSGSPDTPGLNQRAVSGSQMLSGNHWQRLASSELPGGSAASSGGGGESDAAATQPAADARRRSRKAVAPRRAAADDMERERALQEEAEAEREAARAQKLAAKRQKEAAHLLVAGKRDRRPSAKVLTTGDTPELQLQHAREVSRSVSPAARGSAVGPPPQQSAKSVTPAVQPKKSRSGKRKPKGAVPAPAPPQPKAAGRRAGRKRGRSSTPDYGIDLEEDQEVLAAVTAGSGIPPEEAAWWNADPEVDLPGLPISGRLSRARGPMNAQNGDSAAQDQGPGGPGKRTRERTRERSQTAAAPSESKQWWEEDDDAEEPAAKRSARATRAEAAADPDAKPWWDDGTNDDDDGSVPAPTTDSPKLAPTGSLAGAGELDSPNGSGIGGTNGLHDSKAAGRLPVGQQSGSPAEFTPFDRPQAASQAAIAAMLSANGGRRAPPGARYQAAAAGVIRSPSVGSPSSPTPVGSRLRPSSAQRSQDGRSAMKAVSRGGVRMANRAASGTAALKSAAATAAKNTSRRQAAGVLGGGLGIAEGLQSSPSFTQGSLGSYQTPVSQGDAGAPSATPTPQGPLLQGLPEVPIAQFASEAGPVSMASPSVQPTPQVPAVLPAPLERPRSQAHLQLLTLPAPGTQVDGPAAAPHPKAPLLRALPTSLPPPASSSQATAGGAGVAGTPPGGAFAAAAPSTTVNRHQQHLYVPPPQAALPQEFGQSAAGYTAAAGSAGAPAPPQMPFTSAPVAGLAHMAAAVSHSPLQQLPVSSAGPVGEWPPGTDIPHPASHNGGPAAASQCAFLQPAVLQQPLEAPVEIAEHDMTPAESETAEDDQAPHFDGGDSPVAKDDGALGGRGKAKGAQKSRKAEAGKGTLDVPLSAEAVERVEKMVGLLANIRHKAAECAPSTSTPGGTSSAGTLAASIMLPALLPPAPTADADQPSVAAGVHAEVKAEGAPVGDLTALLQSPATSEPIDDLANAPAGTPVSRKRGRSPVGTAMNSAAAAAIANGGGKPLLNPKTVLGEACTAQLQAPDAKDAPPTRSSRYRGVTKHRRSGRWEAHIWVKEMGRQVYLGGYEHEEHAAEAYDVAALKCKGTRVKTNFATSRYTDLTECMDSISLEELIMAVRRQSQGFSRGTSAFRGVTHHPSQRWEARIGIPGSKHIYLGLFNEEREAARMYDAALVRLRGTAAATNFALSDYRDDLAEYHRMQQLLAGAAQTVQAADAAGGDAPSSAGLDGGTLFERWIKSGAWTDGGPGCATLEQQALAIARAVVGAADSSRPEALEAGDATGASVTGLKAAQSQKDKMPRQAVTGAALAAAAATASSAGVQNGMGANGRSGAASDQIVAQEDSLLLGAPACASQQQDLADQVVIPPYEEHLPPQEAPLQSEALPQDLQQPQSWPAHPVPFAAHHFTAGHPAGSSEMTPPAQLQNQNQP